MSLRSHITQLVDLFAKRCTDRSTLDELRRMVEDKGSWHKAHDLFTRIRRKNLEAQRRQDEQANCQYCFEEVCAKTLYNLSKSSAPFDADSPYWIFPNALSLARRLGIPEGEITSIIAA